MSFLPLKAFYNEVITNKHNTGDIWSNLPTHGLLKTSHLPGIVITPACDLANDKVETITYLPIITVSNYIATICFLPELKGILLTLSNQLGYNEIKTVVSCTWPPNNDDIARSKKDIREIDIDSSDTKKESIRDRLVQLLKHIEKINSDSLHSSNLKEISNIFGKKNFDKIITRIITNSFRNDVHFIPEDGQSSSWSVITGHSLIMLRYPLTAPIEIFDLAQSNLEKDWGDKVLKLDTNYQILKSFSAIQPIKTLRIEMPFLHDILNRFVSLYSRLGSPDFTSGTIDKIKCKLKDS